MTTRSRDLLTDKSLNVTTKTRYRIAIVDVHPERIIGGAEAAFRSVGGVLTHEHDIAWIGASYDFYRFLEVVYRCLGTKASKLSLSGDIVPFPVERMTLTTLIPLTSSARSLRRRLSAADVIYSKNEVVEIAFLLYFGGVSALRKTVLAMHTPIKVPESSDIWARVHRGLYRSPLYRSALRRVRAIHALSPAVKADFEYAGFSQREISELMSKTTIIANGIDFAEAADAERKGYVCVGRLTEQKGFDRLRPYLDAIRPQDLTIYGTGDADEQLQAALPNVTFSGAVTRESVAVAFSCARVALFPSRWENQPLSCIEAMRSGCVPIMSDIDAFRDMLPKDYEWLLTNFSDVPRTLALLRRVDSILADPLSAARIQADLRQWASVQYDLCVQAQKVASLLTSLANERAAL